MRTRVAPQLRGLGERELAAHVEAGLAREIDGVLLALISGGSIVASDLVFYNAASMPTSDSGTSGGAVDPLRRPDYTQIAATDKIEAVSSSAGDTTQTITLTGRKADGSLVAETLTLTGTVAVATTASYERLLKAELSATCAGTITVRRQTGPSTLRVIPVGERGFAAIFQQLASDPSVQKDFFMKFFIKNTNGTLALTSSVVKENADPSGVVSFALAAALDDSGSVADRTTSPGLTFNSADKNVPNSQSLSPGSAIGVWLDLTLAAGNAALRTSWTGQISGQTT